MSLATRNPLLKAARSLSRSMAAPTLSTRHLVINQPTKGFDTSSVQHQSSASPPEIQNPQAQFPTRSATIVVDGDHEESQSRMDVNIPPATSSNTIIQTLINQRVSADVIRAQPAPKPVRKRKRRTCAKCARSECSGSQKSSNCRNACQDCNQITCQGRNARKPKKPCHTPGLWDT
jgi:hypothetical protein